MTDKIKIGIFNKTKELGKILGLDGTLELLNLLDQHPLRYKDLESLLNFSHASLLRRLEMLQELGIIKKSPIRSNRRETHEYVLTSRGIDLMKFIISYEKEVNLPIIQRKITN